MSDMKGPTTLTVTGEPVLKKPMFAVVEAGAALESNRKLYNVPHRIAFAFGFWARVSQFHIAEFAKGGGGFTVKSQGAVLKPWLLNVPSFAQPGCWGGAWNPTLLRAGGKPGKTTSKDWIARSRFILKTAYS
jgi:hypothetical protein